MISAKKMIETYVRYGLSEETWDMFRNMRLHNLISENTWNAFYKACHGLEYKGMYAEEIVDEAQNGKVIYRVDEDGIYKKVA